MQSENLLGSNNFVVAGSIPPSKKQNARLQSPTYDGLALLRIFLQGLFNVTVLLGSEIISGNR